jgi:hypothetical protein
MNDSAAERRERASAGPLGDVLTGIAEAAVDRAADERETARRTAVTVDDFARAASRALRARPLSRAEIERKV